MAGRFTIETTFKGVDHMSGVIGGIERKVRGMERALAGPAKFADKGFGAIRQVGSAITYTGVAAAGAATAFALAVAPGADFDAAMSAVGAVSLKTRGEVADLEAKARELGKTTKYSATEVAGGMELMGKAGFENADIIAGIGPILAASAAEGAEFAETTGIISNVMKGMGLAMSETGRVADVLTLASARTNSSISSLGESMAIVAPTARQLNVPLEDAVSAVAMLQDVGLDASVAGSAVATMLTNLSKPPKEVAAKMKAMGVAFRDAKGNMLPFRDVVGQLAKAGKGVGGNMAQVAFFADLVGMRGQKAALNLKDMADPLAKLNKELVEASKGKSQMMADLKLDNFNGDMTKLGNLAKDVGIDFFDLVKGPLRSAAQGTREWLADNQDLIKSDVAGWVKGVTDNIGSMRAGIELGVAVVGNFKNGLVDAFEDSKSIKVFGAVLGSVFGGNDKNGPRMQAYELGKSIGDATDKFILFTGAVKAAEGAVWLFARATTIVKAGAWMLETGAAAGAAIKAYTLFGKVGPASIVAMGTAMNGSKVGSGIAAIGSAAGLGLGPVLAIAAAVGSVGFALYELYGLVKDSGGLMGFGEDAASGIAGFFGSGTKSWGANGFLEGYAGGNDARLNMDAARRFKGEAPQWTDKSAASAASDLTGFGSGYGRTSNDYAGAFGMTPKGMPAPRPPGPYADGYVTPAAAPQVSARDSGSADQARVNQLLQDTIKQMVPQLSAAMKGALTIKLPKGVTAEVSGAPGVEVVQSGGF